MPDLIQINAITNRQFDEGDRSSNSGEDDNSEQIGYPRTILGTDDCYVS